MNTARRHSASYLITHFPLLWRVARTEIRGRYAGSLLGAGWAFLTPLLTLVIYAVVYSVIFKIRVPGLSTAQYVVYIFSGLVPYLMTSEAVSGGVSSVVSSKSVWTNTVFPVDLAPAKAVLISQVPMAVGMTLILVMLLGLGALPWTAILLPVIWILHVCALLGLLWTLALLNLVFRDLQAVMGLALMLLLIASPIAYTPEMVPPRLQIFLLLNPFAYFVRAYQHILVLGRLPDGLTIGVVSGGSLLLFLAGGRFFARAKTALLDYV